MSSKRPVLSPGPSSPPGTEMAGGGSLAGRAGGGGRRRVGGQRLQVGRRRRRQERLVRLVLGAERTPVQSTDGHHIHFVNRARDVSVVSGAAADHQEAFGTVTLILPFDVCFAEMFTALIPKEGKG